MGVFSAFLPDMFDRLKEKWKVKSWQLALIIITFALGGSVTGYAGKKIMNQLAIGKDWIWTLVYILLIILIWPLAVLISFFRLVKFQKNYKI